MGFAWCGSCKQFLPINEFGKCKNGNFGLHILCFTCRKFERDDNAQRYTNQKRQYYEKNHNEVMRKNALWRERNREQTRGQMRIKYKKLKIKFVILAGEVCQRCGYSEFMGALAFHHIDPSQKDIAPVFSINSGDYEKTYAELDKCILLCFNCHQGIHSNEWKGDFIKRNGLGWTLKTKLR
jgi:hypothetical protein